MTPDEFVAFMHDKLAEWQQEYDQKHEAEPASYPGTQDEDDWIEHFTTWLE